MSDKILVVGGYGGVGQHVTGELWARYGERVIVGGRSSARAAQLAQALGATFEFRYVDVSDRRTVDEAMADVGLAIVCVDQPAPHVQEAAIARGAHCLDVTIRPRHLQAVRALHDRAAKAGSTILFTGFMPGVSGVMARYAGENMADLDSLDIALCLAWEGEAGPAGIRYFPNLFVEPVPVVEGGKVRHVPALSNGRRVEFLSPLGIKAAYVLNLPDQTILPETLGVPVTCRFTFDNVAVTNALAWLGKLGLWRTLDQMGYLPKVASFVNSFRAACSRLARKEVGLTVQAYGWRKDGQPIVQRLSLLGDSNYGVTALSTVIMADMIEQGQVTERGVFSPDQVIEPQPFFEALDGAGQPVYITEIKDLKRAVQPPVSPHTPTTVWIAAGVVLFLLIRWMGRRRRRRG